MLVPAAPLSVLAAAATPSGHSAECVLVEEVLIENPLESLLIDLAPVGSGPENRKL